MVVIGPEKQGMAMYSSYSFIACEKLEVWTGLYTIYIEVAVKLVIHWY